MICNSVVYDRKCRAKVCRMTGKMNQRSGQDTKRIVTMQPEAALQPWEDRAHELLRVEMKRRKIGYKELSRLLTPYGVEESPGQLNRKVNRKRFSAAFLFACLAAMEVTIIQVPEQLTPIKLKPNKLKPNNWNT